MVKQRFRPYCTGFRRSEYALGAEKYAVYYYLLNSIVVSDQPESICLGKKLLLTVDERYPRQRSCSEQEKTGYRSLKSQLTITPKGRGIW